LVPVLHSQEAQAAKAQTQDYKLDKNHTFKVSMFDDFDKYARVPEEYAAPEEKPYVPVVSKRGGTSMSYSRLSWALT
jgi:translation initiation factor 3 subunit B